MPSNQAGSVWAQRAVKQTVLRQPILAAFQGSSPSSRPGFITFTLTQDFLHDTFRRKSTEDMLNYSNGIIQATLNAQTSTSTDPPTVPSPPPLLNEPYTPKIQSISLAYEAYSEAVPLSVNSLDAFANPDLQFFHLAYFGQRREHGYQRQQFSFLSDPTVTLLPTYAHAGELLIGLCPLQPQASVSILFQVAEGSANPDREPEDLSWFVLCDNYWKPLSPAEVVLDTTNHLRTSGIIQFVIPPEATGVNTILPGGDERAADAPQIWLKAAITHHVDAPCQLIAVAANGGGGAVSRSRQRPQPSPHPPRSRTTHQNQRRDGQRLRPFTNPLPPLATARLKPAAPSTPAVPNGCAISTAPSPLGTMNG